MKAPNFDLKCKQVVIRRIVHDMSDYRLQPKLQRACKEDIPKFCARVIYSHKDEQDFMEGEVIQCLRNKLAKDPDKLTKPCKRNITLEIRLVHL